MSNDENIRVGFIASTDQWLGGRNYLRNLFAAVLTLPGHPIKPILFAGKRQGDLSVDFPDTEVVRTSILDRKSLPWLVRKGMAKLNAEDMVLRRLLEQHKVSILSHSSHLGKQAGVKIVGWIPDFQHVHLPEFFSREEIQLRETQYRELCIRCDKVIVSSECARADFQKFSPEQAHKAELLRFVASPAPLARAASLETLQRLYAFEGPYFLLPNQFWAHKNHRVVLDALRILKQRRQPFLVLATGSCQDHRNPSFYPSLMRIAAELDVLDSFRVLGQIPFDHLVGLMRHAVAFINPSRFEGWSTSVEEAKSMGKQIVLSDISVHREQAPQHGFFFPPEDPEALAEAMTAAYNGFDTQQDSVMQDEARARFPARQRQFGEAYRAIVMRAAGFQATSL